MEEKITKEKTKLIIPRTDIEYWRKNLTAEQIGKLVLSAWEYINDPDIPALKPDDTEGSSEMLNCVYGFFEEELVSQKAKKRGKRSAAANASADNASADTNASDDTTADGNEADDGCDVEKIIDSYNAAAEQNPALTQEKRKVPGKAKAAAIKERWKEHPDMADFNTVFMRAADSPLLTPPVTLANVIEKRIFDRLLDGSPDDPLSAPAPDKPAEQPAEPAAADTQNKETPSTASEAGLLEAASVEDAAV